MEVVAARKHAEGVACIIVDEAYAAAHTGLGDSHLCPGSDHALLELHPLGVLLNRRLRGAAHRPRHCAVQSKAHLARRIAQEPQDARPTEQQERQPQHDQRARPQHARVRHGEQHEPEVVDAGAVLVVVVGLARLAVGVDHEEQRVADHEPEQPEDVERRVGLGGDRDASRAVAVRQRGAQVAPVHEPEPRPVVSEAEREIDGLHDDPDELATARVVGYVHLPEVGREHRDRENLRHVRERDEEEPRLVEERVVRAELAQLGRRDARWRGGGCREADRARRRWSYGCRRVVGRRGRRHIGCGGGSRCNRRRIMRWRRRGGRGRRGGGGRGRRRRRLHHGGGGRRRAMGSAPNSGVVGSNATLRLAEKSEQAIEFNMFVTSTTSG